MTQGRSPLTSWLDGMEALAVTIYLALTIIVAGVALFALGYVWLNAPPEFGSQGEWLYGGAAAFLVLAWALGQVTWLVTRRRRVADDIERPRLEVRPEGLSFEWTPSGQPAAAPDPAKTWTWNFASVPVQSTFRLDQAQLASAGTLRASGLGWDEIARRVYPDFDGLAPIEQMLYQRALEMAVTTERDKSSQ